MDDSRNECNGSLRAFTLLELSIGLTILSLMAAGVLTVGSVMVEQQQLIGSRQRVEDATKAVSDYFALNGRLPCPARINLAPADVNFGAEAACNSSSSIADGTWRTGAASTNYNAANGVRIGALPVRTLGLQDAAIADEYGNRIWYAMSETFGRAGKAADAVAAISLIDGSGNAIAAPTTDPESPGAAFVIFSTGQKGQGGFRHLTGVATPAGCSSGGLDAENCDRDAVFRDTRFNNGSVAANVFDDIIRWKPKYLLTTSGGGSARAADPNASVQFNHNGTFDGSANFVWDSTNNRLGIGTATPTHTLSVHGALAFTGGPTPSYTTANWGRSIQVWDGTAIMWPKGTSPYSFGIGKSSNAYSQGMYFFRSTKDDATAPALYDLSISSAGNVGIGTAAASHKLHVISDNETAGYFTMSGNSKPGLRVDTSGANSPAVLTNNIGSGYSCSISTSTEAISCNKALAVTSDRREKTAIAPLAGGEMLASVMRLNPVEYHWKDKRKRNGPLEYGFIAQDIEPLFPHLVGESEQEQDGKTTKVTRKTLQYDGLIAPLVASVQELKRELDAVKTQALPAAEDNPATRRPDIDLYLLILCGLQLVLWGLLARRVRRVETIPDTTRLSSRR